MSHTIWDEGQEPGARVVALGVALALTVAVVESTVGDRVGVLFDVCFVMICVGVALLVHPRDFFAVGVMPPLLMVGIFVLFAIGSRDGLGAHHGDGFLQAIVSALGRHSIALFLGYGLALGCLLIRRGRLNKGLAEPGRVTPGTATSRRRPPAPPRVSHPTSR